MKKNIFFLIDDITNFGGTERVTCTLSNHFSKLDFNVTIYSLKSTKGNPQFHLENKVKVISYSKGNWFNIISLFKLSKSTKTPIIVISMGKLSVKSAMCSILHRPFKLIFSEHIAYESFSFFKKLIKRLSYLIADKIILLTDNDRKILSQAESDKFATINNINPYFNEAQHINPFHNRKNIAVAIGRLSYQKNFGRLIDLWKKANINDWVLYIIGDGDEKNTLTSLIGNSENIKLIPANNNLIDYYQNAKLSIMTSRFEGLPMTLIESQYFGIPSISFNCKTGPCEIIIDNKTGYIIDYNRDDYFVEKLKFITMYNNQHILENMHKQCLEYSRRYNPNFIIQKWLDIIK